MTRNYLRFDFNLFKGLVTHLVGLSFALWSFSPDAYRSMFDLPLIKGFVNQSWGRSLDLLSSSFDGYEEYVQAASNWRSCHSIW